MVLPMSERFYRVDKFVVPNRAREEFLTRVRETHDLLRTLPGFLQDFILEQESGPGEFNCVTIVEWEDAKFVESAKSAVMTMRKQTSFNPEELFSRLGIKADLGNYRRIQA
jgi:heme-degrading monooxygenase HmoA